MRVEIWQVKCKLCGVKLQDADKTALQAKLENHVDNECSTVKQMKQWQKEGTYKAMMLVFRMKGLEDKLKKILKHYSKEEIEDVLTAIGEAQKR